MIKKLLTIISLTIALASPVFADASANIHFAISGAQNDNRYFLCVPNVGCLSILKGDNGKTFHFFEPIEMHNIFLTNLANFKVYAMGLPSSCHVTVNPGQTLTIYGRLISNGSKSAISGLGCSLR